MIRYIYSIDSREGKRWRKKIYNKPVIQKLNTHKDTIGTRFPNEPNAELSPTPNEIQNSFLSLQCKYSGHKQA